MSYQNTGNCVAVVLWRKSFFPFFHIFFYYQTNKPTNNKKKWPTFSPSSPKGRQREKKGKICIMERLIILIPISIIFSLVEKQQNLKGKFIYKKDCRYCVGNLFEFIHIFDKFFFICVYLRDFLFFMLCIFFSFFFGDFCWRLFYLHLNEGWNFYFGSVFFMLLLYFGLSQRQQKLKYKVMLPK